jgi:type VI secretion system protein ImpK
MTPGFAAALLPLLGHLVALTIRAERSGCGPAEVEKAELRQRFEAAAARMRGPRTDDWQLASYAVAALVDEMLIVDIPWEGQAWWENHAMEVDLFGSRRRATEFYARAEKAAALPIPDAISIFVLAVLMGFRGILRDSPEQVEAWLRTNSRLVRFGEDQPTLPSLSAPPAGAPPQEGQLKLLWQVVLGIIVATMLLVTAWWAFWLS